MKLLLSLATLSSSAQDRIAQGIFSGKNPPVYTSLYLPCKQKMVIKQQSSLAYNNMPLATQTEKAALPL